MLERTSDLLYSISKGWLALAALAVFAVFIGVILPGQAAQAETYSAETGSPDTSFFYTPADLYRMAEAYGAEGRSAYIRARLTFDVVWPLAYLFFLGTAVSWALTRALPAGDRWRLLNLFPLAGVVFDYLENLSAALVMGRYPDPTPFVDVMTPVFTALKWFFVNGSFVILLAGLVWAGWRWLRRRSAG
ncbi:MAG: hypothetical protein KJZ77_18490 [Anaerolineales bacterium]|nr:hypothetical protein [Anaerolineales bacterium]